MTLRFLITTVAQTAAPRLATDVNDSFMSSGRATAPHPDTPEGAPR